MQTDLLHDLLLALQIPAFRRNGAILPHLLTIHASDWQDSTITTFFPAANRGEMPDRNQNKKQLTDSTQPLAHSDSGCGEPTSRPSLPSLAHAHLSNGENFRSRSISPVLCSVFGRQKSCEKCPKRTETSTKWPPRSPASGPTRFWPGSRNR